MRKYNIGILMTLMSLVACSGDNSSSVSVWRGEKLEQFEKSPFVAIATKDHPNDVFCSGVFIKRDVVLTASHCLLDELSPGDYLIKNNNSYGVATAKHPRKSYKIITTMGSDLGLIKTDRDFDGDIAEIPVGIFSIGNNEEKLSELDLVVTGAGVSHEFTKGIMRQAKQNFRMLWGYWDKELIAGTRNYHICEGDSGGALTAKMFDKHIVVGISSKHFIADDVLSMIPDNGGRTRLRCRHSPAGIFVNIVHPENYKWIRSESEKL